MRESKLPKKNKIQKWSKENRRFNLLTRKLENLQTLQIPNRNNKIFGTQLWSE